ncbi:MAG: carboxypeptidase regulatory-like domain-containing protein [Candidatus Hydrogenedentes bacterium]|nr:carboxypeptidase regulatory-like domain-containing protein [Candidatus Hydrogenedentota bacterium]
MNANVKLGLIIAAFVAAGFLLWKFLGSAETDTVPQVTSTASKAAPKTSTSTGSGSSPDAAGTGQSSTEANPVLRPELMGRQGAGEKKSAATPVGTGKIQGTVRVKEGKRPISGARIILTLQTERSTEQVQAVRSYAAPDPNAPQWESRTDSRGDFKITRLPFGSYAVVATSEDASGTGGAALTEFDPVGEVNIEIQPTDMISGRVHDEAGNAVEGAVVMPRESDEPRKIGVSSDALRVFTNAEGAFELHYLPKAKWKLGVRAKDYAFLLSDLIPTGTKNVDLTLKRGGDASGHVIESQSRKPVEGIQVVAAGPDRKAASTDAEGKFVFAALADGTYSMSVEDQTRILASEAPKCEIAAGGTVDGLEIAVTMGGVVTGRTFNVDNGEPIEGVSIRANTQGRGGAAREGKSGADGVYRIEGLSGGQTMLQRRWKPGLLHGEQREQKTVSVNLGEELAGIDFPIKYGLYLRGRVTDTSGKPLDRVSVTSEDIAGNQEGEETYTIEDGTFEHRGFSPHVKITIRAQKGDQAAEPVGPLTFGEEDMNGVEIVMEKAASISGEVTNKAGKPLENIYISAWASDPVSGRGNGGGASSDAKGNFKIDGLVAGTYNISMQRNDSYRSSQRQSDPIPVAKGQEVTGVHLVFEDESGLTISGRVTNREGKPIKDASANAWSSRGDSQGWTQTDADGRYSISGLKEGAHQVHVNHQEYSQANLPEVMAGSANVDFVLEGHGAIEGQVLDAGTGKPLTTFQVMQALGADVKLGPWMQSQYVTFSSPEGKFRLERVQVGDNTVFAQAKGYAPASAPVLGVQAGQTISGLTLRLTTGASVSGVVHNAAGKPIVGAQIYEGPAPQQFQGYGGPAARATTNENGEFTIDSLAAQEMTLSVVHGEYSNASVTVTPVAGRDTPVDVIMNAGGTITGTVRVAGKPTAGVQVGAYSQTNPGSYVNTQTDASGVYTLAKLPEGTVGVHANVGGGGGSGNRGLSQQAEVAAGQTTVVDFDFGGGSAVIEGVITADGQPVTNAHVNVIMTGSPGAQEAFNARAGSDGRYRIEGLPAGSAAVMVYAMEQQGGLGQQRSATVQLVSGQITRYDLDLNSGATLSGAVTGGRTGEMVVVLALRGEVVITEFSESFFRSNMDKFAGQVQAKDGAYQISGLEPGRYTIVAIAMNPAAGQDVSKMRFTTGGVELAGTAGALDLAIP